MRWFGSEEKTAGFALIQFIRRDTSINGINSNVRQMMNTQMEHGVKRKRKFLTEK